MGEPRLWKFYFPEGAETADDAREVLLTGFVEAEDVARHACEYDFNQCDGWERGMGARFPIVVISPDGEQFRFKGHHEPSVDHFVEEDDFATTEGKE